MLRFAQCCQGLIAIPDHCYTRDKPAAAVKGRPGFFASLSLAALSPALQRTRNWEASWKAFRTPLRLRANQLRRCHQRRRLLRRQTPAPALVSLVHTTSLAYAQACIWAACRRRTPLGLSGVMTRSHGAACMRRPFATGLPTCGPCFLACRRRWRQAMLVSLRGHPPPAHRGLANTYGVHL